MKTTRRVRIAVVAGLAVVVGALPGAMPARAQEDGLVRTATLLPYFAEKVERDQPGASFRGQDLAIGADGQSAPVKQTYLRFSLDTLPSDATIRAWTLRLEVATPGKRPQQVSVFPATFGWSREIRSLPPVLLAWSARPQVSERAVSSRRVPATAGIVDFDLVSPEKERWVDVGKRDVSLMLESPTSSVEYTYHGMCELLGTAPCAKTNSQPRLIVSYTMPAVTAIQWPQSGYDAQQSHRTAWRASADVAEVVSRPVYSPNGYIVGAPAIAQNRLILHTQRDDAGSRKFFMTAVDERGRQAWDVDILAAAKFPPVIGRRGQILVVTEDNLVGIAGDAPSFIIPTALSVLEPGSRPSVREAPTVGANDALYLSTDRGVFARMPDHRRVWWRVGAPGVRFGRVALSPDEKTAYVVVADGAAGTADIRCDNDPGRRPARLVAIDNASGRELWRAGAFDAPRAGSPLPLPVVTSAEVGGRARPFVYVINGHAEGTYLQAFDGQTGQCATLRIAGSFSRPLVSVDGRVTLIHRERSGKSRLCRRAWAPGAGFRELCQTRETDDLSPLSVLAADAKGNVYAIDGTASPQKVRGYSKDLVRLFALDVPETRSAAERKSTNFGDNLLVGADGTLFATNANTLFAIEPKRLATAAPKNLKLGRTDVQGASRTAFLAEQSITVGGDVEIGAAQSVVLRSGGGISFQPKFTVNGGAQVQVKTGMAQP